MPNIEFIKPHEVQDGSGTKYAVGDVIAVSDESAAHFVNRGKAVLTDKKPAASRGESAPPKKKGVLGGLFGKTEEK